ncbi:MAG: HTTM domain-containing protein, partial [Cyanobacteriota bacterium]|nr:HTTM domain-containing protein [Cyanobacteriota bacterium]
MGLFWGMFLPLGARFSLDTNRQRQRLTSSEEILSIASAGILLQVAMMYLFTGLWKLNPIWLNGDALAIALTDVTVTRPLGNWLLNFPSLLHFLTQATLGLELLGPLLLFSPVGTRFLRPITLICLLGLHIGIEMTLTVMMFSYASLALLMLFVPASWWDRFSHSTLLRKPGSDPGKPLTDSINAIEPNDTSSSWPPWCRRLGRALGCCCIGYAILFNVFTLTYRQGWPPALNKFYQVGTLMNFGQRWTMFDKPQDHLYRFAFFGRLENGQQVELLRNQVTSREDPFPATAVPFPTQRWMQLHREATAPAGSFFRHAMARYLATHW